jgi:hypothetical protein
LIITTITIATIGFNNNNYYFSLLLRCGAITTTPFQSAAGTLRCDLSSPCPSGGCSCLGERCGVVFVGVVVVTIAIAGFFANTHLFFFPAKFLFLYLPNTLTYLSALFTTIPSSFLQARANDADFFDEDDGRGGGGSGGGGAALRSSSMTPEEISNDVLMVDTSSFRVTKPLILGTPPPARADMEVIFDPKHGQLLVFSGYGEE